MPSKTKNPRSLEIQGSIAIGFASADCIRLFGEDYYSSSDHTFCDIGPNVSCSLILKSEYAILFGVPIAIFGVTWNAFLLSIHMAALE